ncbi:protein of unknown function [Magnetospirillum sp. XM-1]|uniref:hypothetical protein n=1 Tax=Magnetospirillum sp. XM-1 TaxID=1663591 RepID=UPI00073DDB08|nr:hypothetical protein [Magnetospirillum sp. XM-1]CUW41710.1 protein of unknown function [Magnetospirillum sp. XM-1]
MRLNDFDGSYDDFIPPSEGIDVGNANDQHPTLMYDVNKAFDAMRQCLARVERLIDQTEQKLADSQLSVGIRVVER